MPQTEVAVASGTIRVLVVDDSAVVRGLISRHLAAENGLTVVGTAANGELALNELGRSEVDVVVLDIEMPVMDGLTALKHIVARYPRIRVIMASTLTRRNAEISLTALNLGAADYVAKPESGLGSAEEFQRELASKVRALAPRRRPVPAATVTAAVPVRHAPFPAPAAALRPASPVPVHGTRPLKSRPGIIAIGSSTGGPPALMQLFESLRGAVDQPILLTQHMPATFTALLAEQLSRVGDRPCAEGKDGERIVAGRCYVAPGGWHMVVARDGAHPILRLNQEPPESFCRPAVDPMFRSVAKVYGSSVLGVVLTGMGADGARGCEAIVQAGGHFIVQDEASSVVWGMPGAAAATGLADQILPLNQVGPWVRRISGMTP